MSIDAWLTGKSPANHMYEPIYPLKKTNSKQLWHIAYWSLELGVTFVLYLGRVLLSRWMLGIKVVLKEKNVHVLPKVVLQPQSNYCGAVSPPALLMLAMMR